MIGEKIKYHRKKANLTLKELALRTGLSVGYLSNLERGQTSPTYDNLCAICEALSISVVDLITKNLSYEPYVKAGTGSKIYPEDYRFHYEAATDDNLAITGARMVFPADYYGSEVSWGHDTDEVGVVIKGSLLWEIGDGERYLQEPGDVIYIKAGTRHKWQKTGEGECISYWFRINFAPETSVRFRNRFVDGLFEKHDKVDDGDES